MQQQKLDHYVKKERTSIIYMLGNYNVDHLGNTHNTLDLPSYKGLTLGFYSRVSQEVQRSPLHALDMDSTYRRPMHHKLNNKNSHDDTCLWATTLQAPLRPCIESHNVDVVSILKHQGAKNIGMMPCQSSSILSLFNLVCQKFDLKYVLQ